MQEINSSDTLCMSSSLQETRAAKHWSMPKGSAEEGRISRLRSKQRPAPTLQWDGEGGSRLS